MTTPVRILLVEDSSAYAKLVGLLLHEQFGAAITTRHAATLAEGVVAAHIAARRGA